MSGTFGSFGAALSGLRYSQVAMDIANNNLANVGVDGYVRRRVVGETAETAQTAGLWSRGTGIGDGVRISGTQRMSDLFLDARARNETGRQARLDALAEVMDRVESGIGEPGENGVSAALSEFRASWQNLGNNPGNSAARSQVLATARGVVDAVRAQARNLDDEAAEVHQRLSIELQQVNTMAHDLAALNRNIAEATLNGNEPDALLDQRDRLALGLSELTGGTATLRSDGGFDFAIGGQMLVSGRTVGTLTATSGLTDTGTGDGTPLAYAVTLDGATAPVTVDGKIGGLTDAVDRVIAGYRSGLDAVASRLATEMNAGHAAGYDQAGVAGTPLFTLDLANPAGSIAVAITDPARVAASAVPGGGLDGSHADLLSASSEVESSYQQLVGVFGTEVASTHRLAANQAVLTRQVTATRESMAGVSIDEEMVALMAAQRQFEAASRVMTTLDSMLDTLINRTGLVR